jgi:hypothetical protein
MPKKRAGNKPNMMKCKLCKFKGNQTEMRLHEPGCRRKYLLHVGAKFHVRLNNAIVPVEIVEFLEGEAIRCINLATGRSIRLKSYRRFRDWMQKANVKYSKVS